MRGKVVPPQNGVGAIGPRSLDSHDGHKDNSLNWPKFRALFPELDFYTEDMIDLDSNAFARDYHYADRAHQLLRHLTPFATIVEVLVPLKIEELTCNITHSKHYHSTKAAQEAIDFLDTVPSRVQLALQKAKLRFRLFDVFPSDYSVADCMKLRCKAGKYKSPMAGYATKDIYPLVEGAVVPNPRPRASEQLFPDISTLGIDQNPKNQHKKSTPPSADGPTAKPKRKWGDLKPSAPFGTPQKRAWLDRDDSEPLPSPEVKVEKSTPQPDPQFKRRKHAAKEPKASEQQPVRQKKELLTLDGEIERVNKVRLDYCAALTDGAKNDVLSDAGFNTIKQVHDRCTFLMRSWPYQWPDPRS